MTIVATLCYIRNKSHTLMLFRNKKPNDIHQGKWNGLGGKLIRGESPEECVIREVYEESGLTIKTPVMKGVLTFPEFDGANDWIVFVFTANQFTGDLCESPEGTLEWIENSRLLEIPLWEGDQVFLPCLEKSSFFSGKFVYHKGRLERYDMIWH